jgi:predicted transcriptional regulator
MEPKFDTLNIVYELIKEKTDPTQTVLTINELLLHQNRPWDELVLHLEELNKEGYIILHQLSVAVVSITNKGLELARIAEKVQNEQLRNLRFS